MSIQALKDSVRDNFVVTKNEVEAALAECERMETALRELVWHNPLHHDFDSYLYDLAQWGLGKVERRPDPGDYGLNILIPNNLITLEGEKSK